MTEDIRKNRFKEDHPTDSTKWFKWSTLPPFYCALPRNCLFSICLRSLPPSGFPTNDLTTKNKYRTVSLANKWPPLAMLAECTTNLTKLRKCAFGTIPKVATTYRLHPMLCFRLISIHIRMIVSLEWAWIRRGGRFF